MQPTEQPPEGEESVGGEDAPAPIEPGGEAIPPGRGSGETPALPLLLPVVAFGGLIVVLVITAFLAGSRTEERAREHLQRAEALLEEGKTEHALRLLERAAHQDPGLTPARCLLGELLLEKRRQADAEPHLEACLQGLGEEESAERARIEELLREARKGRAPAGRLQP